MRTRLFFLTINSGLLLLCLCTSCAPIEALPSSLTPTPPISRPIVASTLPLHEYWRKALYCNGDYSAYERPAIVALPGRVICTANEAESVGLGLKVLDTADGHVLWEIEAGPGMSYAVADLQRVYFLNNFTIRTYDLATGQSSWDYLLPDHHRYYLRPEGEQLVAWTYGSKGIIWYYLDATTGARLATTEVLPEATDNRWLWLGQFPQFTLYTKDRASDLWAVAADSGAIVWHTQTPYPMEHPALLINDNLLLTGADSGVVILEAQTGKILWRNGTAQIPFFLSNPVIVGNSLYALEPEARLVQRELATGREVGYVQFAPMTTDYQSQRYYIASDGQMLFVSFGDSQELIALGP